MSNQEKQEPIGYISLTGVLYCHRNGCVWEHCTPREVTPIYKASVLDKVLYPQPVCDSCRREIKDVTGGQEHESD